MGEKFLEAYEGGVGEIVEKKSRFIANVRPVKTEEEAQAFIEEMRKRYWDARHNCTAFVIGERNELCRCSDDGEPSGTAGRPMLEVLLGEGVHNICVVVTRYFGGVLLGTGGLVRAYQGAVKAGLAGSVILEKIHGKIVGITSDYNGIGKIQYLIAQGGYTTISTEYTDIVVTRVAMPVEDVNGFLKKVTEGTNGRAKLEIESDTYYAVHDGEVIFL